MKKTLALLLLLTAAAGCSETGENAGDTPAAETEAADIIAPAEEEAEQIPEMTMARLNVLLEDAYAEEKE